MALTNQQINALAVAVKQARDSGRPLTRAKPKPQESKADLEAKVYAKAKQLGGML